MFLHIFYPHMFPLIMGVTRDYSVDVQSKNSIQQTKIYESVSEFNLKNHSISMNRHQNFVRSGSGTSLAPTRNLSSFPLGKFLYFCCVMLLDVA